MTPRTGVRRMAMTVTMTAMGAASTLGLTGCSLAVSSSGGGGGAVDVGVGARAAGVADSATAGAADSATAGAAHGAGAGGARTAAPRVGPPPSVSLPEPEDYRLENGLRVILVERHDLPVVSLDLIFPGGASAHPAEQAGLAALTADMLDEGTTSRSALELADAVSLLGATLSTSAGYDASAVRLGVLRPRLGPALRLMADVVMRPAFAPEELARVKRDRATRILQSRDRPALLAANAFAEVLYGPHHPYGVPLVGTTTSLAALDRDDVVRFHRAQYRPDGAVLVAAGDVDRPALDSLLADAFAGWSGRIEAGPEAPPPPAITGRTMYLVDRPGSAQSVIRLGRVAVDRAAPDYYVLQVLNTVLGGSFTSRLNMKLREEKGYTYGARSSFDMRRLPGPFVASAAVATAVTDSSVVEFLREIDRIAREPVPDDELAQGRSYLALRLPQRFETVDDLVARFAELALYGLPLDSYNGYVEGVAAVGADDVLAAARRYLDTARMAIVIAGDRAAIEAPLRALGVAPVVLLDGKAEAGKGSR